MIRAVIAIALFVALTACGGGSDDTPKEPESTSSQFGKARFGQARY